MLFNRKTAATTTAFKPDQKVSLATQYCSCTTIDYITITSSSLPGLFHNHKRKSVAASMGRTVCTYESILIPETHLVHVYLPLFLLLDHIKCSYCALGTARTNTILIRMYLHKKTFSLYIFFTRFHCYELFTFIQRYLCT